MTAESEKSLGDDATFAGRVTQPVSSRDVSLGDERTLGDGLAGQETIIDDIEVIDLAARYRIEGTLGQGGMGAVLLATDTRLDRKVAIKRILGEAADNRMAVQRFLTEAKSIAALNHPNIVQIYDYGRAKDGPFLIMEFVDGGSLFDRCRDGALPLEDAVDLACQLCDGLAKAHDLGIIHRDIKPANVLLTKDGTPKLTDFGLAKAQAGDHGQTMTGAVLGTPDFMPPEQRRDASLVDHRSDIWSLAATVYQMTTGRSPKIIRFDLLPEELTNVLGKALEDAKEDRYQTARELRDVLKASLRAAAPDPSAIVQGQCPSCEVQNDSSRRFCRGCGGSLEAPCLSCEKAMPIGEEICGSCGAKQTPLTANRREAMAARQAEADGLLGDYEFDRAARIAAELRDEPHPRLSHLKEWGKEFLTEIEKSRQHQVGQTVEALVEASKHEEAHDYLSAIFALDSVPAAMRFTVLPGARETVSNGLARVKKTQAEVRRLESLVKERVAAKSLDGLLVEVERLLALQPDRSDVAKLRAQLLERQARQVTARDKAVASAAALLDARDYEGALATLSALPSSARSVDFTHLHERASTLVEQVLRLSAAIREAVAAKRFDGLNATIDEYLQLKPADAEVLKLRQSLAARDEKIASEIKSRLHQAKTLEQACRFAEAAKILEVIPFHRREDATRSSLLHCQMAAAERATALKALASASAGEYGSALQAAAGYRRLLEAARLDDEEFNGLSRTAEEAHAVDERGRRLRRTFAGVAASAAAVVVLVCGILWLRAHQQAASLADALQAARWDDALSIDPDNGTAFLGRARAKLTAQPPDIDGAFTDIDRADKLLHVSDDAKAARGAAHAARAVDHVKTDRLTEASADLAEAVQLNTDAQVLANARAAISAAWLARAEQSAAEGRTSDLRNACDAATKAGAATEDVASLRARGKALEAIEMWDRRESGKAVNKAIEAIDTNAALAIATLRSAKGKDILEPVLHEYRKRSDVFAAADRWEEAFKVVAVAKQIDEQAAQWLRNILTLDKLRLLSPAVLALAPPVRNSVGIELKLIPAGTFQMGDATSSVGSHMVTLTQPFFIGVHEVSNAQWQRVMGSLPSQWKEDEQPVEQVSWEDSVAFCRMLSALPAEMSAGCKYRLPTEAEWEYACRAGSTSHFSCGDDERLLGEYGWFNANSGKQSHPIRQKKPNAWGLYDVHGNVFEWCSDWFNDYRVAAVTDPSGPSSGVHRVRRGGSWDHAGIGCRSAYRSGTDPSDRYDFQGFRVAMSLPGTMATDAVFDESLRDTGDTRPSDASDWIVLFRSANPLDWGKPVGAADNAATDYARAANDFPSDIRYVRIKRMDTQESAIMPLRREWLMERRDEGRYRWQPLVQQTVAFAGHCLGIFDSELHGRGLTESNIGAIGVGAVPNVGWHSGWGFGEVWYQHQQGYAWAGKPIGKTTFEISAKAGELSPDEKGVLIE